MLRDKALLSRRSIMVLGLAASMAGIAAPGAAVAQEWPSRAVTMVVPYGPGASNDTFTRAISEVLSKNLGQPFVVDNRSGASGFTGANSVRNSDPDGYTWLEAPSAISGIKPIAGLDLDPLVDLRPVGLLATSPTAMGVHAGLPVNNLQEFIEYAKNNDIFFAYAGKGGTSRIHGELFKKLTGIEMEGVNYKNSADAQADVVAGRAQAIWVSAASLRGQVEAGQIKLLAYADDNYPKTAPPAPSMAEGGVDGFQDAQLFWALFAPKDTPDDIVMKMNAAVNEALQDPGIQELMANSGAVPRPGPPEALVQMLQNEEKAIADFLARVPID